MFPTENRLPPQVSFLHVVLEFFRACQHTNDAFSASLEKKYIQINKIDRKSYYSHLPDLQILTVLVLQFSFPRLIQNSVFTVAFVGGRMQKT